MSVVLLKSIVRIGYADGVAPRLVAEMPLYKIRCDAGKTLKMRPVSGVFPTLPTDPAAARSWRRCRRKAMPDRGS
jgi:hypothetical protein